MAQRLFGTSLEKAQRLRKEQPGGNEASKMEFRIDGKPVTQFEVAQSESEYGTFQYSIHLERGTHQFAVAFLNDFYDPKAPDKNRRDRNLLVRDVQVIGPTEIFSPEPSAT